MTDPDDLTAIAADDELLEDLRAGCAPPTGDQVTRHLAAWRDFSQADTVLPVDLETRARQIHNQRHRAGTAPVCGFCRAEAAGAPRRSLLRRILTPRHPVRAGYLAVGVVLLGCWTAWIPTVPLPVAITAWWAALVLLGLAIRWFVIAGRDTPDPTK